MHKRWEEELGGLRGRKSDHDVSAGPRVVIAVDDPACGAPVQRPCGCSGPKIRDRGNGTGQRINQSRQPSRSEGAESPSARRSWTPSEPHQERAVLL